MGSLQASVVLILSTCRRRHTHTDTHTDTHLCLRFHSHPQNASVVWGSRKLFVVTDAETQLKFTARVLAARRQWLWPIFCPFHQFVSAIFFFNSSNVFQVVLGLWIVFVWLSFLVVFTKYTITFFFYCHLLRHIICVTFDIQYFVFTTFPKSISGLFFGRCSFFSLFLHIKTLTSYIRNIWSTRNFEKNLVFWFCSKSHCLSAADNSF